MSGTTLTPQAVGNLVSLKGVGQQQLSASLVNSYRVAAVAERLAAHVKSGYRGEAMEFFNLCLSLSRGIDYAVANNEVPAIAQDLPGLLKQICQRKSDKVLEAAIMVLMISVKNACRTGWFSDKETEELFFLANEIGSSFCSLGDVKTGASCSLSVIDTIMERFYPMMKMGQILASLEVKSGYGAHVLDFHISKSTHYSPQEKIRLLVAQTDNIETSACIISPPQVNFLLNGKGVDKRINVTMDTGPQLPSVVTGMLKFGSNLLQAVGQFNGHYTIVVAFMSITPSPDTPVLKDYSQFTVSPSDSDPDLIEGPSRISLNCPISYTRIKTPVKGHLCKHLQCFDFGNYVNINLRRPSWRCPHCNQYVCYLDLRVDQNMVKVLREVGENVAEVIISMDGSWKAGLENDDDLGQAHDKAFQNEISEQEESTRVSSALPIVLDLTEDDTEMDTLSACETEDVKPLCNTNRVNQTVPAHLEDDFWSGIYLPNGSLTSGIRSDTQMDGGISHSGPANYLHLPVLTDAVSPVLDRETESRVNTDLVASAMHTQYSSNNLQLQQPQFASSNATVSNEYGRLANTVLPRTPTAVQALPAQTSGLQQRSRTSFNTPPSASLSSQVGQSITPTANGVPAVCSDVERQQHFSRPRMSPPQVSNIAPSSMQPPSQTTQNWDRHGQSAQQVVGLPAPSQLQSANRTSLGLMEFQNAHLQQAFNPRTPQTVGQLSSANRSSSHLLRAHIQQGSVRVETGQTSSSLDNQQRFVIGQQQRVAMMARQSPSTPVQNQSPRNRAILPANAEGFRTAALEQSRNVVETVQAVSGADGSPDLSSGENWRPTGRMRGSLSGRAYSAALNQFIIQPTQPTPAASRPPSNLSAPPHLVAAQQSLIANVSTQVPQTKNGHPQ
ncbi:E4 SUMO-protein ligase PIAL2-like [Pyrus x bretschneideri]|uniref:E4 SUMO-protein ligase PIAL2-like n=1 Tax=Pyrus x bretschneideri TaxID=225117 RepID=UPI0020304A11|nr:E4 SUMO-protein ligase PIAL2-like [Pyrus x bretschneideri]